MRNHNPQVLIDQAAVLASTVKFLQSPWLTINNLLAQGGNVTEAAWKSVAETFNWEVIAKDFPILARAVALIIHDNPLAKNILLQIIKADILLLSDVEIMAEVHHDSQLAWELTLVAYAVGGRYSDVARKFQPWLLNVDICVHDYDHEKTPSALLGRVMPFFPKQ